MVAEDFCKEFDTSILLNAFDTIKLVRPPDLTPLRPALAYFPPEARSIAFYLSVSLIVFVLFLVERGPIRRTIGKLYTETRGTRWRRLPPETGEWRPYKPRSPKRHSILDVFIMSTSNVCRCKISGSATTQSKAS